MTIINNLGLPEEAFRSIASRVRDRGTFTIDREGKIVFWSTLAERATGYSPEDVRGKTITDLMSEEDAKKVRKLLRLGRSFSEGVRIIRKDGSRVRVRMHAIPIDDGYGILFEIVPRFEGAFRVFAKVNEVLLKADSERKLSDVCRTIVEEADYVLAWICDPTAKAVAIVGRGEPDTTLSERAVKESRTIVERDEGGSTIALPLLYEGELLGVLGIRSDGDAFDEGEIGLLERLAANVAYGIKTMRERRRREELEREREELLNELKILHEIDLAIISNRPLHEVAERFLTRLKEYVGFEAGVFYIRRDGMKLLASVGGLRGKPPLSYRRVDDIGKLPNPGDFEREVLNLDLNSYVSIPLIAKGELVGVLAVASRSSVKSDFLERVANQLAIAFREAILSEARKELLRQLRENIHTYALLVDQIRNPLTAITAMVEARISDEKLRRFILEQVDRILDVVRRLEEGWLESEKIRRLIERGRI